MKRLSRAWRSLRRLIWPLILATAIPAAPYGPPAPGAVGAATTAQGAAAASEDGAIAPAGTWTTEGGSTARSGVSATAPLAADPAVVWTYETGGTIECEPLVWDELTVVSVRESRFKRSLHVLGTWDGRARVSVPVPAALPLLPSLWGDVLAVRPAPERVELLRITSGRLQPMRTIQTRAASGLVLFQDELYVLDGARMLHHDLDEREPIWEKVVDGVFRGTPSLRGDHVFAVWYDKRGYARLISVDRASGRKHSEFPFGHHGGAVPDEEAPLELTVLEHEVFIELPLPMEIGGESYRVARVGRRGGSLGDGSGGSSVHSFRTSPVSWRDGWIVRDATGSRSPRASTAGSSEDSDRWMASHTDGVQTKSVVLSDRSNHPELLAAKASLSLADDVYYFHDMAVQADDFRIHWKSGLSPRLRPVPAREALLIVEGEGRLSALRTPHAGRSPAKDEATRLIQRLETELGDGLAALVLRAVRTNDRKLVQSLYDEASVRGANERSLQRAGQALQAPPRRTGKVDERGADALRLERERLIESFQTKLLYHAENTADAALARALYRETLQRVPSSRAAREGVRALVPPDAPVVEPFDAVSWLTFLEVQGQTEVDFVPPQENPGGDLGAGREFLQREVLAWRPDLFGYRTDRLFIVTPPSRPGAVARLLEVGELVCDALEDLFGGRVRTNASELVLALYETEREYFEQSNRESSKPELARGWSGGHYSPEEELSRMYVPPDDASRLLGVYAHELTHHWLATRSPFASRGWRARAAQKGYWIAEGFATMVEEFRFYPSERRWEWEDPRAESLDAVASADDSQLLPWPELFAMTQIDFHRLDDEREIAIPLTWRLGAQGRVSTIRLFYAQAGATCHYLLRGEGGRHRPALLKLMEDYSAGRDRDVEQVFGISAEELGSRVVAFARQANGKR